MERPKQRVWLSLSLVASRQSRPAARVIHPFLFYPSLDPIAHKNCWLGNAPPSFCPCGPWPALHASAHAEPTFSKIPKRSHRIDRCIIISRQAVLGRFAGRRRSQKLQRYRLVSALPLHSWSSARSAVQCQT